MVNLVDEEMGKLIVIRPLFGKFAVSKKMGPELLRIVVVIDVDSLPFGALFEGNNFML